MLLGYVVTKVITLVIIAVLAKINIYFNANVVANAIPCPLTLNKLMIEIAAIDLSIIRKQIKKNIFTLV